MEASILQASCQLFSRYGIQQLRMDDLAAQMGISKKTIYKFYPSREDLIGEVLREFTARHHRELEAVRPGSQDTLEELTGYILALIHQYRQWSPQFFSDLKKLYPLRWEAMRKDIGRQMLDLLRRNLEKGIQEGVYRGSIHPALLVTLWQQHLHNDHQYCEQLSAEYSKMEVFRQSVYLFLYGIVRPEATPRLEELLGRIHEAILQQQNNISLDPLRDLNPSMI